MGPACRARGADDDYSSSLPPVPALSSSAVSRRFFRADLRNNRRFTLSTATHAILMISVTGTGWDQTAHDDVLFQATQFIALAGYGSFGQNARRFWNDAAEMKDSVAKEALVIPSRSREKVAGILPSASS